MFTYQVEFTGELGEVVMRVESPLMVDCEHEENVHTIMDMAYSIAQIENGEDFFEAIDGYAAGLYEVGHG